LVPLCGEGGTAGMFAEQKGASRSEIRTLNNLAMKLINLADNTKGMNLKTKPYGASGGLILGLSLCAQVEFQPASSFLLDTLGLKKMIALNDVIISGEGKFDLQTLHEKAPGLILGETLKQGKKCILICGSIDEKCRMRYKQNVRFIALSQYFSSATESIKNIDFGLERAVDEIAEFLLLSYNS
jgi:glycerate kinase